MRRRALLLAGMGALVAPKRALAFANIKERRFRAACRARLEASFPGGVMASPATEAFVRRYAELHVLTAGAYALDRAVHHFLTSTNVIVHLEQGEALSFDDVFYPPRTPCANRMSAFWAPEGEHPDA